MLIIDGTMKMFHRIPYLLLILTLASNNQQWDSFVEAQSRPSSFRIKEKFSCGRRGNFVCNGNATTTKEGLLKLLPYPKGRNEPVEYYRDASGSALYKKRLRILDRSQEKVASFHASFSLQIERDLENPSYSPGDGMAFVLFPNVSFIGLSGGNLGAYTTDFKGTVLAVEFDTYNNMESDVENKPGPANPGHVGINVNVPKSLKAKYVAEFSLVTAKRVFAWVDYNSTALSFDVRVSNKSVKPENPFISYSLNMFDTFGDQEYVWVGFSAANGGLYSFYTVYDLRFTSILQKSHFVGSPTMLAPTPELVGNVSPSNTPQLAPEPDPPTPIRSGVSPLPDLSVPPIYPDTNRTMDLNASPACLSPNLLAPVAFFTWTTLFVSRLVV